jgi:hypothetical protein
MESDAEYVLEYAQHGVRDGRRQEASPTPPKLVERSSSYHWMADVANATLVPIEGKHQMSSLETFHFAGLFLAL